ncbi:MAG: Dabb family protein [Anaerolineae bacterium]|nr:MAG: Dabb family protein [Anaerolineae bacterium]
MIRHVACFKFRTHELPSRITDLMNNLAAIPDQVPEVISWSVGTNVLPIEFNYDAALVADFADKDALLRYYRNPAVRAVIDQIISVAANRISVDFEVT